MLELLEKDEKIKLKILTQLYSNSQGCTLTQLKEELGISIKTIKIYIDELTDYLAQWAPLIWIERQKMSYSIKRQEGFNIEIVYRSMKKETAFISLYHYYFTGQFIGTEQYAKEYFCSQSRVYSRLKKLRQLLQPYEIYFGSSTKYYELYGNEQMIRFHTFHYYWDIYRGVEWPFDSQLEVKCYQLVNELADYLQVRFAKVEQQKLALWLAIIATRINLTKYVRVDSQLVNLMMESSFGKEYGRAFLSFFEDDLPEDHEIIKNELSFFLVACLFSNKHFITTEMLEKAKIAELLDFYSNLKKHMFYDGVFENEADQSLGLLLEGIYGSVAKFKNQ